TQVIILTGHGSRYSATRALVRDAFDYLAKPCDIDLLASRIEEAYRAKHHGFRTDLKKALDIMTPINEVMTLSADSQVRHAMEKWFDPTQDAAITASKKERAPDVIVVLDEKAVITGVLTKIDIIRAVRPEYIAASDVPTEESARFSSIFWNGFFSDRVTTIAGKKIREIMSERPPVISENANLLEVAHLMWKDAKRLLLVQDISRIIGIIRDQDIFEEILAAMTHKSDARG
ncbi:MAG: CBS domain-containing protein, partial [Desulfobacula sp.]|nr:CBS domain-containing protein [Desulfobacula sp.]